MDALVSSVAQIAGGEVLNPSPCYFNLQRVRTKTPFLAADLEAHPAPLPMMSSGGDHGKHPWAGASTMKAVSNHPVEQGWTPTPVEPHHRPDGVLRYAGDCLGLLLVVALNCAC
jgi:hypothetical protein